MNLGFGRNINSCVDIFLFNLHIIKKLQFATLFLIEKIQKMTILFGPLRPFLMQWMLLLSVLPYTTSTGQVSMPAPPDYSALYYWAAHPEQADAADSLPRRIKATDGQASARADVFFVHPTTYTQDIRPEESMNVDLQDEALNRRTDLSTILNQASVFNGACRVFAPRYRQAHISAFYLKDSLAKKEIFDLAYQDVKSAFEYYLRHHNQGRPIVIAAHSQGTVHAVRLLREFFDQKALYSQLVVAYLVGMPVQPGTFKAIRPGEVSDQVGCFVSWNTYAKGYYPPNYREALHTAVATNPLSWRMDSTYVSYQQNIAGVGYGFKAVPRLSDAQCHRGMLWIGRPHVKGAFLLRTKNWHVADYNLFWSNIRENVAERVTAFTEVYASEKRTNTR